MKQGLALGGVWTRVWQVTMVRGNSQHRVLDHVASRCSFSPCICFILLCSWLSWLFHSHRSTWLPGWHPQLPTSPSAPIWHPLRDLVWECPIPRSKNLLDKVTCAREVVAELGLFISLIQTQLQGPTSAVGGGSVQKWGKRDMEPGLDRCSLIASP